MVVDPRNGFGGFVYALMPQRKRRRACPLLAAPMPRINQAGGGYNGGVPTRFGLGSNQLHVRPAPVRRSVMNNAVLTPELTVPPLHRKPRTPMIGGKTDGLLF